MESEGHGRCQPKPHRVEVTRGDVQIAYEFAREYVADKQHAGKGGWRGGTAWPFTAFGIDVGTDYAGTVVGKVGEIAMCKLCGVSPDLAIRRRGDGGEDLRIPCGPVQVKTATGNFSVRLVRLPAENVPWFVFATWLDYSHEVLVHGYMHKSLIERQPVGRAKKNGGGWRNYEVPLDHLYPIASLLKYRPIAGAV